MGSMGHGDGTLAVPIRQGKPLCVTTLHFLQASLCLSAHPSPFSPAFPRPRPAWRRRHVHGRSVRLPPGSKNSDVCLPHWRIFRNFTAQIIYNVNDMAITFFKTPQQSIIATSSAEALSQADIEKLCWLYGEADVLEATRLEGCFVGPRREMITPWSTNAVEITQNMDIHGIERIEEYFPVASAEAEFDPMLQRMYKDGLDQDIFTVNIEPRPIVEITDLDTYNEEEGLALSAEEIEYLHKVESQLGRPLTDSEVFGFARINSEHCRHKIFGGTFIIDGEEKESSLFRDDKEDHPGEPQPHPVGLQGQRGLQPWTQGGALRSGQPCRT